MRKLLLLVMLGLASAGHATVTAYFTAESYTTGTMVTATAWAGTDGGYFTTAYQFSPGYATIATESTWGTNAIKLDSGNGGWMSIGNSKTAYTYTDFSCRAALGDQDWLWVRWNGSYSGFSIKLQI